MLAEFAQSLKIVEIYRSIFLFFEQLDQWSAIEHE